jgi:prephenate dehydrogenase
MQTIAIIGISGQFGQFMAQLFLHDGKHVIGISRSEPQNPELHSHTHFTYYPGDATKRLPPGTLAAVKQADVVLFSVPIHLTEKSIRTLTPHLQPGQLVTDVTSVKVMPVQAMLATASEQVEVLGMHPMFSPTFALEGKNVILTPERIHEDKLAEVVALYERRQATVSIMTAQEHDRMIAVMQAMTHFLFWVYGRALVKLGWDTEHYRDKETTFYAMVQPLLQRVLSFDPDLYAGIQMYNAEVPKVLESFLESAEELYAPIAQGHEGAIKRKMQAIIDKLPKDQDAIAQTNALYRMLKEYEAEEEKS